MRQLQPTPGDLPAADQMTLPAPASLAKIIPIMPGPACTTTVSPYSSRPDSQRMP